MRRELFRFLPVVLFVYVFSSFAAEANSSSTSATSSSSNSILSRMSLLSMNTFGTNGYVDAKKDQNFSSFNNLRYKVTGKDSVGAVVIINKSLVGEEKWTLSDPFINYNRLDIAKMGSASIGAQARVGFAVSDRSVLTQQKIGYVGVGPTVRFKAGIYSLLGIARVTRHLYEFKQDINGGVNTEWSMTSLLVNNFAVTDKVSLTVTLVYLNARKFGGVNTASSYEHSEEISYALNKNTTIALGHTLGGSIIDYEVGQDKEFDLFSARNSTFYSSLTFSI